MYSAPSARTPISPYDADMKVRELAIRHFRGFEQLTLKPKNHAVLMGEPGAGRSDIIEALSRVLDPDAAGTRTTTELDFHRKDISCPIAITVTIGELGGELEQRFLDYLELWNKSENTLVPESESTEEVDEAQHAWVLRLEYCARWLPADERSEEWVHFPKLSDPEADQYTYVPRRDLQQLGFAQLRWGTGRLLDLGPRSTFRRIIEGSTGDDFGGAVSDYVQAVATAAEQFTDSAQVKAALEEVLGPLRDLLRIGNTQLQSLIQFAPEGGAPSGLLRSLGPAIDLGDGVGVLPAWRRGSTIASLLRIAEALAACSGARNILAADDLGDGIDPASAAHLVSSMRRLAGQVWITTRVPAVAELFEPEEVIRLGRGGDGSKFARLGRSPTTKAEAIAAKHWHRNLLPALSYRSVVVLEGPHDFASLHSLALRLFREAGDPLPATRGVCLISAGAAGSGGYPTVLRLADAARQMGLRAVGVIDGDTSADARQFLASNSSLADAVIRLPDDMAVEAAFVRGLPEPVLRQALSDVAASAILAEPPGLGQLGGSQLESTAISFIKKHSLHAPFVEALPASDLPAVAVEVLRRAVEVASSDASGIVQV